MPESEIIELKINNSGNDCEKVKSLADEYLHGELSESSEEKKFIETHIIGCKDCLCYIAEEKTYLDEIKLAEYVPEISVSASVMDRIIENRMIVDKPARRRFMPPVGFMSAAAVVIIMFAIARGGPLNLFMKASQDNSSVEIGSGNNKDIAMYAENAEEAAYDAEYYDGGTSAPAAGKAAADSGVFIANADDAAFEPFNEAQSYQTATTDADVMADNADILMTESGDIAESVESDTPLPAVFGMEVPGAAISPRIGFHEFATDELNAENQEGGDSGENIEGEEGIQTTVSMAEPEAFEIPAAVAESRFSSEMDEYIPEISGLEINKFYEFYYIGSNQADFAEKKLNIFKDIEIYLHDDTHGVVDIIDKKYKDVLEKNLIENNIEIGEILIKEQDGEYIAVIYWFN